MPTHRSPLAARVICRPACRSKTEESGDNKHNRCRLRHSAGRTYAQVSDIVQAGWQVPGFFTAFAGAAGNNIIGVTFSFFFVDENGDPTDINGDGRADTGLAEIYYNTRFAWGNSGALNVVDTYTITTHETGHAMSLGHFGKV